MTKKKGFIPSLLFGSIILCTLAIVAFFVFQGEEVKEIIKDGFSDDEQVSHTNVEEVINEHGNISNIESLDTFVDKLKDHQKAKINVIHYGIEGQRVVEELTYNGESVHVYRSVDEEFIEEYRCENVVTNEEGRKKQYILKRCTGNFTGDTVILSTAIEDEG
ncbi:DUF4362 domain-containing protein [Rossellomorea aquimaris]|uniref:Uncharacterized protein DUF4362 n=1 Tax=Rossellomorea aquimaris TaxID=189382 RepID=A0A366EUW7_9BACI|nr:DUF4362 domain-containing protein [Rossellomorea aquimaris]RBP06201.1 uncharacterized protein DUF4362 [Rossellomorea aquimaris]